MMYTVLKKIYIFFMGSIVGTIRLLPLRFLELIGQCFPENSFGCRIRGWFYKPFLKKCGRNLQVSLRVKLENLNEIEFGDNVYIGYGVWLNGYKGGIIFEDEVMLGPYVTIVAGNHEQNNGSYRFSHGTAGQVIIGYGSWLAAKSTVVAGVKVGKGVLVAANSVVTKDVEDYKKVGGVPAKSLLK